MPVVQLSEKDREEVFRRFERLEEWLAGTIDDLRRKTVDDDAQLLLTLWVALCLEVAKRGGETGLTTERVLTQIPAGWLSGGWRALAVATDGDESPADASETDTVRSPSAGPPDAASTAEAERPLPPGISGDSREIVGQGEALTIPDVMAITLLDLRGYAGIPGNDGSLERSADGVLVVLELTLENLSKEPAYLSEFGVHLIDDDGSIYSCTTGLAKDQKTSLRDPVLYKTIQPKGQRHGTIAFDIPPSARVHYLRVARKWSVLNEDQGYGYARLPNQSNGPDSTPHQ
jgi:hypothetical protein